MNFLSNRAEILILGGGIVGCSVAYHLALAGCRDVVVIDSGRIAEPPGSSGHAPGLMGQLSSSTALSAAAQYSVELYSRVPQERPAFLRVGSLEVARNSARLAEYERKAAQAAKAGLTAEVISTERIRQLVPFMDVGELLGGLFIPGDGVVSAARAHCGLMNLAKASGVRFVDGVTAQGLHIESGRLRAIETTQGRIDCDRLVVAAGIWGGRFLQSAGLHAPVIPVQHPYVKTGALALLGEDAAEAEYPMVRDLDHLVYYRQHGNCLGYGWYSHTPASFDVSQSAVAELPFASELFGHAPNLALFPFLKDASTPYRINGLFSMTPDGLPLIGELEEVAGLWLAEAVWFTHAGGVGKLVAELMLERTASFDWRDFDARRFAKADPAACKSQALDLYRRIYG